jgi:hypothetical protein
VHEPRDRRRRRGRLETLSKSETDGNSPSIYRKAGLQRPAFLFKKTRYQNTSFAINQY